MAKSLLTAGLLALQAGNLRLAEQDLQRASELDGKNGLIWSALAETELRLKQTDKAMAAAAHAEPLAGGDGAVSHALAMFYTHLERPEKAALLERQYAESGKADPDALARAASLYLEAGEPAAAADLAARAVSQHDTAAAEDTLGRALKATRRSVEAAPHFRKAWEASPLADEQIAFDYAQSLLEQQSFDQAGAVAEKMLAAQAENAQMQLVLGVSRYGQRRFDQAIAAFLEVIRIDPAIPQPYLFLSNLLEQAGPALDRIVAADEAWVKREPGNGQAQLTLAKALLQKDRKSERARELLQRAITSNDSAWEPHFQMGVLLETSHEYAAAAEELKKSITLNPKQPLPHYHLARVYDRLGLTEQARAERDLHLALTH